MKVGFFMELKPLLMLTRYTFVTFRCYNRLLSFSAMGEKVNPSSRIKWLFHDLERLWSMFFITFPGHMKEELSSTVLFINR